ncbi:MULTISPECIES: hypothetical protein [unclassified Arthrobacter]|uniref:hypothetical protein n=1 Tax=unclassified Arthrobacter TaxID=235627 RepID=UPI001F2F2B31|nr:hypothetical protein [Arthrobacter sp. FW305-BF8]UKA53765.1 hypothetical protein LFT45_18965 [Arthrobacter sp. FW305-BF8]
MSTEGNGQEDQNSGTSPQTQGDGVPDSGSGVAVGAGEPNTFEPEEGTDSTRTGAPGSDQIATAEDTPDVEETPVDTTEPS